MALANQAKHSFSYDPAKLVLTQETVEYDFNKDGTADFTRTLDRSRDNLLRPTGFQLKNGAIIETAAAYTFDNANRLSTVSDGTNTFTYAYLAQAPGLVQSVTGPAHTVTNTYEPHRNVLVTKTNSVPSVSSVVSQFDYTSNKLGQRTALASTGTAFTTPHNWDWTYNGPGEVINADSSNNTFDQSWNFDGIGNRKTATYYDPATGNPATAGYTTNPWNQYTAITGQPAGRTQDPDGNLTVGTIPADVSANSTLVWDAENRLTKITKPNGDIIDFQYDFQSRRISKKVTTASVVTTHTAFVYDVWNPIAEYSITATLTSTLTKSYLWGMDLSGSMQGAGGIGGLLAVTDYPPTAGSPATAGYPTFDGNGNVSEYINASGVAVAHYEYNAFGKTIVKIGALADNFAHRFSTKPLDAETGFYYYGHRYYDPSTGRWPSRDPIEEEGGVNLYGFVGNDPIKRWDRLGLWTTDAHNAIVDDWLGEDKYLEKKCHCCIINSKKIIKQASAVLDGFHAKLQFLPTLIGNNTFWGAQSSFNTAHHAMRRKGQTVAQATSEYQSFVTAQKDRALELADKVADLEGKKRCKKVEEALFYVGYAFHTISDSTSPSHKGFQEWGGLRWAATHIDEVRNHASVEGSDQVDAYLSETNEKLNSYLKRTLDKVLDSCE